MLLQPRLHQIEILALKKPLKKKFEIIKSQFVIYLPERNQRIYIFNNNNKCSNNKCSNRCNSNSYYSNSSYNFSSHKYNNFRLNNLI